MKNFVILAQMLVCAIALDAQDFKKLRVGAALGFAVGDGKGASVGTLWSLEPGYRLNDHLLMNMRAELASVVRGTAKEVDSSPDVAGISSYTLNSQYYLSGNTVRPFVGIGLGIFSLEGVKIERALGAP